MIHKNLASLLLLAATMGSFTACKETPKTVTGSVELSLELQKKLQPTAVLYVFARRAGQTSGPPVAVKRYPQPILFPVEFSLSAQDAMIPDTPFEGQLSIVARVSQSGSVMPTQPGDIEGRPETSSVGVGASGVKIVLTDVK